MTSSSWQRVLAIALSIALCVGLGAASAQSRVSKNAQSGSVIFQATASAPTNIIGKNYNVGGMISMSGNIGVTVSNPDATVSASVAKISNDSSITTSGSLRLRVLVTSVPFRESRAYYTIGEAALNPLAPQYSYLNFAPTMPLVIPPDGVYYVSVAIFEYEGGCGSADGFCPDDVVTFRNQVEVYGGVFYDYPSDSATTTAVEYYHAGFNHYFFTAIADEISLLDSGYFSGWARTGRTFGIWKFDIGGLAAVCRFFSTSFAPKSSHFYTPFINECAIVKNNPNWQYEGIVAYLALPYNDGTCPTGLPFYRLYNNGMGGAPNHRYTTSLFVRSGMIGAGWIPEGYGIGVIGCVPY